MNENRKKIIVNEILYWKSTRMLPQQYRDYLLALYTEGDGMNKTSLNSRRNRGFISYLVLLMVPISLFFLYFTELSRILQTVIGAFFVIFGIFLSIFYFKKRLAFATAVISTALVTLLYSVDLTTKFFPDHSLALYIVLGVNCMIWLIGGLRLKLLYFTISGILGLLLLVGSLFR